MARNLKKFPGAAEISESVFKKASGPADRSLSALARGKGVGCHHPARCAGEPTLSKDSRQMEYKHIFVAIEK